MFSFLIALTIAGPINEDQSDLAGFLSETQNHNELINERIRRQVKRHKGFSFMKRRFGRSVEKTSQMDDIVHSVEENKELDSNNQEEDRIRAGEETGRKENRVYVQARESSQTRDAYQVNEQANAKSPRENSDSVPPKSK